MAMLVSSLVDTVTDAFRSYVREQPPTTALTGTLSDSATSFTVADARAISKGLVQINDEMVYVRSVDYVTSQVTLEPWGRAQSGSTAVSYSAGAKITTAPLYPRVRVRDLISDTMQEMFPEIFAVGSTLLTFIPAKVNYALPADTYHVLQVAHNPPGPSGSWDPVARWRQNKTATAVELEIMSTATPGANRVRVLYVKNAPGSLIFTDDLQAMGYPNSIRDLITLGTVARMVGFTETSRIQASSLESLGRGEAVPANAATALSKYLYGFYRARLVDEAAKLQRRYPVLSHFTR